MRKGYLENNPLSLYSAIKSKDNFATFLAAQSASSHGR